MAGFNSYGITIEGTKTDRETRENTEILTLIGEFMSENEL